MLRFTANNDDGFEYELPDETQKILDSFDEKELKTTLNESRYSIHIDHETRKKRKKK